MYVCMYKVRKTDMPKCISFHEATGRLVITGRVHCLSFWLQIYYAHLTILLL